MIFVHVPKTSGSSVHLGVKRTIGRPAVRIVGGHTKADIEVVRADKGKFSYVGGHITYLEAASIFDSAIYVTAIRNPLHRILSQYFHVLRSNRNALIKRYVEDMPGNGFSVFYRRMGRKRGNLSCKFICGEADHGKAIEYLKCYFALVWLADHPETGWPHLFRMLRPDPAAEPRALDATNAASVAEDENNLSSGARPRDYDAFLAEENRKLVIADNVEDLRLFEWVSAEGGMLLSPELRALAETNAAPALANQRTGS